MKVLATENEETLPNTVPEYSHFLVVWTNTFYFRIFCG